MSDEQEVMGTLGAADLAAEQEAAAGVHPGATVKLPVATKEGGFYVGQMEPSRDPGGDGAEALTKVYPSGKETVLTS